MQLTGARIKKKKRTTPETYHYCTFSSQQEMNYDMQAWCVGRIAMQARKRHNYKIMLCVHDVDLELE